jgi:hypothetical protein
MLARRYLKPHFRPVNKGFPMYSMLIDRVACAILSVAVGVFALEVAFFVVLINK